MSAEGDDAAAKTPEERAKLAAQLDASLDAFMEEMQERNTDFHYTDGWSEDTWEEEMEQHPAFRTKPFEPGEEVPPEIEALQQLKYGEDVEPTDRARNHKDDGNHCFRMRKYQWAVDAYTEGLRVRCPDRELNAVLYTNRAAAHAHLGNTRSALRDATFARKFKRDHLKALVRGAECCADLGMNDACVRAWCDPGLVLSPGHARLVEVRARAQRQAKLAARDARRRDQEEAAERRASEALVEAVRRRGALLDLPEAAGVEEVIDSLRAARSHTAGLMVKVVSSADDGECLAWPVFFLYPEVGQSDMIEAWADVDRVGDQVATVLAQPPAWDHRGRYTPENVDVFYEDRLTNLFVRVPLEATLREALEMKNNSIADGVPTFYVLAKDCPQEMRSKYGINVTNN